jgi:hypothetical protein
MDAWACPWKAIRQSTRALVSETTHPKEYAMTEQQNGADNGGPRETADDGHRDRLSQLLEQISARVREFNELRQTYDWAIDAAAFAAAVDDLDEAVTEAHEAIGDVLGDDGVWHVPEPHR